MCCLEVAQHAGSSAKTHNYPQSFSRGTVIRNPALIFLRKPKILSHSFPSQVISPRILPKIPRALVCCVQGRPEAMFDTTIRLTQNMLRKNGVKNEFVTRGRICRALTNLAWEKIKFLASLFVCAQHSITFSSIILQFLNRQESTKQSKAREEVLYLSLIHI